eukprot:COSAG02_NODE_25770_length_649_cov_1.278182_1_plen_106_part_00
MQLSNQLSRYICQHTELQRSLDVEGHTWRNAVWHYHGSPFARSEHDFKLLPWNNTSRTGHLMLRLVLLRLVRLRLVLAMSTWRSYSAASNAAATTSTVLCCEPSL